MAHTPDLLPVTPFVRARVALERLARRAAKLDAGRIPNKLAAYASVVRYAAEDRDWGRLGAVQADLAELVRAYESADPEDPVTALLEDAYAAVAALEPPEAYEEERRAAT